MSTTNSENNVKAGLFVLVSVLVGVVVVFVLGDLWGAISGPTMKSYRVSYSVTDGVGFLSAGSTVRVGGLTLGKVDSVHLVPNQDPQRTIEIDFQIPSDLKLYSNAVATIQSGLISATSFVSITSLGWDAAHRSTGDTGSDGTLLSSSDLLIGRSSGGMLGSLLGSEASKKLSGTISNIEDISSRLRENGYALEWILGTEQAESIANGTGTLGEVFDRMGTDGYVIEWVLGQEPGQDVKTLLARINSDWIGSDGKPGWSDEVSTVLDQGENVADIVKNVREIVVGNRKQFEAIINDVADAARDAKGVMAELQANAPLWSADIGGSLANLSLSSQQILLLMQEARNAPWRLLYQPSEQEVTNELLYEASRNFVFGAADLKSAAASMDRLVNARGDELSTDARDFKLVRENLNAAVSRYERAQTQLSKVLQGATIPKPK
ncbi:MAG: MCE family protein [Phycisphaerae bacterium]|nr:MCE family protein [Phycisphaerae bacterium]MBT5382385.1 MCE family protein [Phycisphaerae bacterium]MBT5583781.1 MCE family protein [Phycisphaerae bacterium]MBT5656714.1 MCE family protein [Phycisphaerae bacterium]